MSLESSRFIGNSSSPNLMETFQSRNFHDHMNHSTISKKQNLFRTEAVTFLKTSVRFCLIQLNSLIKDQLKGYRLQMKLEKQVEEFKKTKQRKQLVEDLHKIQKFRQKESDQLKARYDEYQKQQQKKQNLIEQVAVMKRQMARRKKQQHDRKIQHVRKRFMHSQIEDTQNRLSRADSTMSHRSAQTKDKLTTSRPRNIHTSVNQRKTITNQTQEEEQKRITNYLRKMKHAESRIIQKQLTNQQRKQKSIKEEVKNLTQERNQKEQSIMKNWEQKLETKMGSFYQNLSRSQLETGNFMMNKSRMKQQLRERVIKNKEMSDNLLVNKQVFFYLRTLDNFMRRKVDKENLYRNHQRKIDLLRTKSSFMNKYLLTNSVRFKSKNRNQKNKAKETSAFSMKKLTKSRILSPTRLSPKRKDKHFSSIFQQQCSLLDNEDSFYPEMAEFLTNTKSEFLRKKLQKEQEKAKADKTKKTARFHHKN